MENKTLFALDIETVCNVADCPGYGKSDNSCVDSFTGKRLTVGHAVDFNRNKITCVGIWNPDYDCVFRDMQKFFEWLAFNQDAVFIGHHFQFDVLTLKAHDIDIFCRWVHDTKIMAHVHNTKIPDLWIKQYNSQRAARNKHLPKGQGHRVGSANSLKCLAPFHLNVPKFWEDPSNHDSDEYVLKDCEYTYRLFEYFRDHMTDDEWDFYKNKAIEYERFVSQVTLKGIKVDLVELERMAKEDQIKAEELELKMREQWFEHMNEYKELQKKKLKIKYNEMAGKQIEKVKKDQGKVNLVIGRYNLLFDKACIKIREFNFNSDDQMLWLLKDRLKLNVTDYTGEESVGKEVIERLALNNDELKVLTEWTKINKRLHAYYPAYRRSNFNSILHPTYDTSGTKTGRLSSKSVNAQQIPPALKHLLIPRDGNVFVDLDMAQIEVKLIALFTEDPLLFSLIQNDISLHSYNVNVFLGTNYKVDKNTDEVKEQAKHLRDAVKRCNFSIFYGARKNRVKSSFQAFGIDLTLDECNNIIKNMMDEYQAVFDFHKEITAYFEEGNVWCNLLGRPIKIQDPNDAYMQGFNRLIQSSASDINTQAALDAQTGWNKKGIDAHVVQLVHDNIKVECKEEQAEQVLKDLTREMTKFILKNRYGRINLTVEGEILGRTNKQKRTGT